MTFESYCELQYHGLGYDECMEYAEFMNIYGKALKENYDKYIKG